METAGKKCVLTAIISIILAALASGGTVYFWQQSVADGLQNEILELKAKNNQITVVYPEETNEAEEELVQNSGVDDDCILALRDGMAEQLQPANTVEYDTLSDVDFIIFNHTLSEILPRMCDYQKSQEVDNAICIVMEIDELGGDAVSALKKYRDSL